MAKRPITDAEKRLWNKITQTVKPLKGPVSAPKVNKEEFEKLLSAHSHLKLPSQSTLKSPNSGAKATDIQRKLLDTVPDQIPSTPLENKETDRKVRRGKTYVDATIDLHGFTQIAARSALSAFLMHHRHDGSKCVLVITGKGKAGGGVIKSRLVEWLSQPDIRAHVSSYSIAHQKHGGEGAYYVFLRKLVKLT